MNSSAGTYSILNYYRSEAMIEIDAGDKHKKLILLKRANAMSIAPPKMGTKKFRYL